MTYITETAPRATFPHGILKAMGQGFARFGRILAIASENDARLHEVARLRSLSDAELAEMGLSRDTIVHHVYRDLFHV